jgi:hypothetical protein
MSSIKIQRSNEYSNMLRNYKIYVDGKNVGEIGNGENKEFTVLPGEHSLEVKIDWCGSPKIPLKLEAGQVETVKVSGFKNANLLIPLSGGVIGLHFIVKMAFSIDYLIYLVIPTFLFLAYYLTFGRKKFLRIAKV